MENKDIQHTELRESVDQKKNFLKKSYADADTLTMLNKGIGKLTDRLNEMPADQQASLAKDIKNFQISVHKTVEDRKNAVSSLIQTITNRIPVPNEKYIPARENAEVTKIAELEVDKEEKKKVVKDFEKWAELINTHLQVPDTPESRERFLSFLGKRLGSNPDTWNIATFKDWELYKRPGTYYRKEYWIQYTQNRPLFPGSDVYEPKYELGGMVSLKDDANQVVETLVADEALPSPVEIADKAKAVLSSNTQHQFVDIIAKIGQPRLVLKWLAAYYKAMQANLFDKKEIEAVHYLEKFIKANYIQLEEKKEE